MGCSEVTVQIPKDWTPFCLVSLLSPESFDWAKSFLGSSTWLTLINCSDSSSSLAFAIPNACTQNAVVSCDSLDALLVPSEKLVELSDETAGVEEEEGNPILPTGLEATPVQSPKPAPGQKKLIKETPLVDTSIRRSPRIKIRNGGFKVDSCSSKNCLTCSATPPSLPMHLIKAIGEEACMIPPGKITDETLL